MAFIKEIGPSHEEVHLDKVENKTRSGITDFTRHIYSRVGQDTDSVPASPRDTDSAPSSPQDHKGKRQLTLQEVAQEEERLRSGQENRLTEKLVIPEGPLPGGMRRSDAGTSGDQRIGKQIGEYRLRSILGQGSFARVYLGANVDSRKPSAAVKVLNIPLIGPEANQFFAEVQAIERLKHENIVKMYHYCVEDIEHIYPYLALEYAHHGTLDDFHRQNTPSYPRLPLRQIAEHLDHLGSGLDYAHAPERKIVHRDLKPANLLVVKKPNGEIVLKIGDLGLAQVFQKTTSRKTQNFAGTIAYAALLSS
jgi:serine/threonine protein kinase